MTTVFAKILAGELPCEKVLETENILAIKDIAPVAPVHILIIPKKPLRDLQSILPEDLPLMAEVVKVAQKLAEEYKITDGYRLITNNGRGAGQMVFHLHFHLIGGRPLAALG